MRHATVALGAALGVACSEPSWCEVRREVVLAERCDAGPCTPVGAVVSVVGLDGGAALRLEGPDAVGAYAIPKEVRGDVLVRIERPGARTVERKANVFTGDPPERSEAEGGRCIRNVFVFELRAQADGGTAPGVAP